MPKQRITKEMVVEAAFEIARSEGMEKVIVKNIAARLGCSVQPIYSYCANMEGLRQDVVARTARFYQEYLAAHVDHSDLFRSTGQTYIRLSKEEPHLFKLYFLRGRSDIHSLDDLYTREGSPKVAAYLMETLGISPDKARAFHLNMLIYTTGISAILATTGADIPSEEISLQLEQAHRAFLALSKEV